MNDPEIRHLLFKRLARRKGFLPSQIVEEAPLNNGLIRADVVICSNRLECFEIKSKSDNLKRLLAQAIQYEQSFDYISIVCATKHVARARDIIPPWWGVIEVQDDGTLKQINKVGKNPYVNAKGMIDLLENEESRTLLRSHGFNKGISGLCHSKLKSKIAEVLKTEDIREGIIDILKARNNTWKPSLQASADTLSVIQA